MRSMGHGAWGKRVTQFVELIELLGLTPAYRQAGKKSDKPKPLSKL